MKRVAFEHFRCSKCEHAVPASRRAFDQTTLDALTWCRGCRKNIMAKAWQCKCHIPWFRCPEHRSTPNDMRQQKSIFKTFEDSQKAHKDPKAKRVLKRKLEEMHNGNSSSSDDEGANFRKMVCPKGPMNNPGNRKSRKGQKRKFEELSFSCNDQNHSCRKIKASFLSTSLRNRFSHLVDCSPVHSMQPCARDVQISVGEA